MTGTGAPTSSATDLTISGTPRAAANVSHFARDHEDRLRQDVQLAQHVFHPAPARHLDLAPRVSQDDLHRLAPRVALRPSTPVTPSGTPAHASRRGSARDGSRRAGSEAATTARGRDRRGENG